jgi:multidrug efflux system outer membrane protein
MSWWRLLPLALLAGCIAKVGPEHQAPNPPLPAAYAGAAPAATQVDAWWQGFGDAALDRLVRQALAENLDIAAAGARLAEARALLTVADSAGGPQLDANLTAQERGTISGDSENEPPVVSAAGLFDWMPDLFGGRARATESAAAELRRRDALQADVRRQVAADVVRRYVEIGRDRARLQLVEDSLGLRRQTLELVRQRFDAGLAAQLDVSRAAADVAATQAQRGPLQLSVATSRNALAVLLAGQSAEGPAAPPGFAGGPPLGLPADLLRRRPDLIAAEANLARATADIGVAEAQLYPQLRIPANLTLGLESLSGGGTIDSFVAGIAASLAIPLFDTGGRRAQVDAAEARASEALLLYRQTLLRAVQQAETALAALAAAMARAADLRAAVAASEQAAQQADNLYRQGLTGFLDVLDAQRTLLDNRQSLTAAEADIGLATADLYSAIGAPGT